MKINCTQLSKSFSIQSSSHRLFENPLCNDAPSVSPRSRSWPRVLGTLASWLKTLFNKAGVLLIELALTNTSKKTVFVKQDEGFGPTYTIKVSVQTDRIQGNAMARVVRYEYVNLVLLPTQSPVIQSRVMPLSPYRGVAAGAMLNLGQYRFTVPEEFSKSQMAASARVQTAKGELTFQTTLN
jgi:hypothetical protein